MFRDRDELAGSANLGEAIHSALKDSRFLVVLCSKNSAKSKWVNKEIEDFQALEKGDRILALILDGEPNAKNPEEECFPPALRYPAEPIAGDLRKEGDGKARGFLKILAGISQVGFDDLYRRHERAQAKKRMIAAITAVLLISVFAGLAGYATLQRSRAIAQKKQAELSEEEANSQKQNAMHQTELAENREQQIRIQSSRSDFIYAMEKNEQGCPDIALAYLARALETNPDNLVARALLLEVILTKPWCKLVSTADYPCMLSSYSRESGRFIAGFTGKEIRILDTLSGEMINSPTLDYGKIKSVTLDRAGTRAISISEKGDLIVWNVETGACIGKSGDHRGAYNSLFSPDGRFVLSKSSSDVKLWESATMELIGSAQNVQKAFWSKDSLRIALCSNDHMARIWDLTTTELGKPMPHTKKVMGADFSPDGKLLATTSYDKCLRVWDTETMELVGTEWYGSWSELLCFNSSGSKLLTGNGEKLYGKTPEFQVSRWDVEGTKLIGEPMSHQSFIWSAVYSPSDSCVLTASHDTTARLWRGLSLSPDPAPMHHMDSVDFADFSKDGQWIITQDRQCNLCIWEKSIYPQKRRTSFSHSSDDLNFADFSDDGQLVMTGSRDGARVWDVKTGKPVTALMKHDLGASSMRLSPDRRFVVTTSYDKKARVWDASNGNLVSPPMLHKSYLESAVFSPNGDYILSLTMNGRVVLWSTESWGRVAELSIAGQRIESATFVSDGSRIVTFFNNGDICEWDAFSGEQVSGSIQRVQQLDPHIVSENGRFAVISSNLSYQVWDYSAGKTIGAKILHTSPVHTVHFNPDGTRLITMCHDKTVHIWDTSTGKREGMVIRSGGELVKNANLSADGRWLLTASMDGTVQIWETATGLPVGVKYCLGHSLVGASKINSTGDHVLVRIGCYASVYSINFGSEFNPQEVRMLPSLAKYIGGKVLDSQNGGLMTIDPSRRIEMREELKKYGGDCEFGQLIEKAIYPIFECPFILPEAEQYVPRRNE